MKLFKIVILLFITGIIVGCGSGEDKNRDKTGSFAGIEWGSSKEEVSTKLKEAGFDIISDARDVDSVMFKGEFMDMKTTGIVILNEIKPTVDECYLFYKCATIEAIPGIRGEIVELYDEEKKYDEFIATKIAVYINPSSYDTFFVKYDDILSLLVKKYGKPTHSTHEAGGMDSEANVLKLIRLELSSRKGDDEYTWSDKWLIDERGGAIALKIDHGKIIIVYESIAFGADFASKEKNKETAL